MNYTIDKVISGAALDKVDEAVRAALAEEGFGVLTEIDVQSVMKAKIGEDMAGYRILGACNPKLAFAAIGAEPRVGAMLPCNVILRETPEGVMVSAVDPAASMQAIDNPGLADLARDVRSRLERVIAAV
ncbi:DUF302 domain-containing protein [Oceanomicrobium pacificus]|uniref:DUF302 domain-containing protein n=1 Tax=Oceanomicrobium pacificus TaxID=2692916 RepID=A0A6B0THM9_9RHOB|nr:DUF302 domain-containing protein [Oceanomicrobium pacificus]MXU63917.1 DUF302 domain-containing protein [Oceanomicrobium pacificus]